MASILILVLGFFLFQPAFCSMGSEVNAMDCSTDMECGMPVDCEMPLEEDNSDREGEQKECMIIFCSGCTFINVEKTVLSLQLPKIHLQKRFIIDDNRVISTSDDFWHPPKSLLIT